MTNTQLKEILEAFIVWWEKGAYSDDEMQFRKLLMAEWGYDEYFANSATAFFAGVMLIQRDIDKVIDEMVEQGISEAIDKLP